MNARAPVVDNSHTANMSKNISYFVFQVKKQVWVCDSNYTRVST